MAITTNAICNSFKKELLEGTHNFKSSGGNSFKLALYTSSATLLQTIKYRPQVNMLQEEVH